MNQAQKITRKFERNGRSGYRILAEAIRYQPSAVYRWSYPKAKGGTGGVIPAPAVPLVQEAAERLRVRLSPKDWSPS